MDTPRPIANTTLRDANQNGHPTSTMQQASPTANESLFDQDRLMRAYETARDDLLSECTQQGHWVGELSSSALSTATAVSALSLVERHADVGRDGNPAAKSAIDSVQLEIISELVCNALQWLADHQNEDGGWGDTDKSSSNIATTMLVRAAFHLTAVPAGHGDLLQRADAYIKKEGGIAGLRRRFGNDKTFAVPILTNCALAELVPWSEVSPLPFELACLSQRTFRHLRLPVVSYAIPALVAVGQTRYWHRKPLNPITRIIRHFARKPSLRTLENMQPESGGYLEATPLTSFVVMSLASMNLTSHPVVRDGVEFLIDSVRDDGSWPIDTNLATWVTTLSINALSAGGENVSQLDCLDWLLDCQNTERHPFTDADPGGWGWTDLSGAVPDADDTPGALLALSNWLNCDSDTNRDKICKAAENGLGWLLDLQNNDGGWPTFCRGWGFLPFDRSGSDLTAHAIRALHAWKHRQLDNNHTSQVAPTSTKVEPLEVRIDSAIKKGLTYLASQQRRDGSWVPLWFGNQHRPGEENPIYGTARVLLAYRDLDRLDCAEAGRGLAWLLSTQLADGGWGGPRPAVKKNAAPSTASVEETALAIEALLPAVDQPEVARALQRGMAWLVESVESGRYREATPIGLYFAKLWYHEKLYSPTFTVSALGHAVRVLQARTETSARLTPSTST